MSNSQEITRLMHGKNPHEAIGAFKLYNLRWVFFWKSAWQIHCWDALIDLLEHKTPKDIINGQSFHKTISTTINSAIGNINFIDNFSQKNKRDHDNRHQ
jgi:hypothetical protein